MKYLFFFLITFSNIAYAGVGTGMAIGMATGMAIQSQSDSDTALSIALCKAQSNIADVKNCLVELQKEQNKSDLITAIGMIILIIIFIFIIIILD